MLNQLKEVKRDCMENCLEHKTELYHDVIHCLASALEYRDSYTKGHSARVGDMSLALAEMMGLDENLSELIHMAGHLHDIGKIGIPDKILNKEGTLSDTEWLIMKTHPQMGADMVRNSRSLAEVSLIIKQHHERWDGRGYPNRLAGEKIHIAARIIALCDSIDAMSSTRPYRKPFTWDDIRNEVHRNIGLQFDPGFGCYVDRLIDLWINLQSGNTKQCALFQVKK